MPGHKHVRDAAYTREFCAEFRIWHLCYSLEKSASHWERDFPELALRIRFAMPPSKWLTFWRRSLFSAPRYSSTWTDCPVLSRMGDKTKLFARSKRSGNMVSVVFFPWYPLK